ncbi:MAG: GYD domain-containing protein [Candidatus Latescibacterota bacterium]|nr:MAG: GYD domain-containing protein [Candidatus Latescibacterota bacterium]
MPTFIRLASLTEQGIRNIRNLRAMIDETRVIMQEHGVHLQQGWATLGDYDVVAVIEAPDAKTAAQVSALIAARGNFRATTLSAVALAELSEAVQE